MRKSVAALVIMAGVASSALEAAPIDYGVLEWQSGLSIPAASRRRRARYLYRKAPAEKAEVIQAKAEPISDTKSVRIIPITRWPLWCARIGGTECP
jgi:hypothetical protein